VICEDFKWQAPVLHGARRGTIRADGLKLALVKMWESSDEVDAFPVLAIHDEIVVESPAEKADEVKDWLR
jgi:DNA polymerase I-like protein with 3'-5' exonuclease and polymerase domains